MTIYSEGIKAYNDNKSLEENPYDRLTDTDKYNIWVAGFWHGYEVDLEGETQNER